MKLTKNDFLNVLRDVTRSKILSIREARSIFDQRVKKLIKAQRYEVRSQELYGVAAAQQVFTHQAEEVRALFSADADALQAEYEGQRGLIRTYQKDLKKFINNFVWQETQLAKLSTHMAASLKLQLDTRLKKNDIMYRNPALYDEAFVERMEHTHPDSELVKDAEGRAMLIKKQNLMESQIYDKAFDFYGQEIRLLTLPERENVVESAIIREKDGQIA